MSVVDDGLELLFQPSAKAGLDGTREFGKRQLVAIGEEAERDHHEARRLHIRSIAAEPFLQRFEHPVADKALGHCARLAVSGGADKHRPPSDPVVFNCEASATQEAHPLPPEPGSQTLAAARRTHTTSQ